MARPIGFDAARRAVDAALHRYLPPATEEPRTLHAAMRYGVFAGGGGKRIRPAIAVMACRACGAPARAALPVAAAIECVHTYSLIHDDLPAMDDDDIRRGQQACHKKFGEAAAVLAGDALLTLAFGIIAERMPPRAAVSAAAELARAIGTRGMAGGQMIDIGSQGKRMTRAALDRVNALKTARLFEASARLGAIAAGAPQAATRAMARYGEAIGMAFQIVDDCLDGDGYARLIGASRARAAGRLYTAAAKRALAAFGRKGVARPSRAALDSIAGLAALADSLAERIR